MKNRILSVLGFMSGTSVDGVNIAHITTDGHDIFELKSSGDYGIEQDERNLIYQAMDEVKSAFSSGTLSLSTDFAKDAITTAHERALGRYIEEFDVDLGTIDLVGVHGQTLYHQAPIDGKKATSLQIFDQDRFKKNFNCPLVYNFRQADIDAFGQGAPLVPIFHKALVEKYKISTPVILVNIGGVTNITYIDQESLIAFDTGPGNGLMDKWIQSFGSASYDDGGKLAKSGKCDKEALSKLLSHEYFQMPFPKSLDRFTFSLSMVSHLNLIDGLATLCEFTVQSLKLAIENIDKNISTIILCGGGRLNHFLVNRIKHSNPHASVILSEDVGLDGNAIEAQAFAYLAARRFYNIPSSFPQTTGARQAVINGEILY